MKEWLRRNEGKVPLIVTAILVVMVLVAMELAHMQPHFGAGERLRDQFEEEGMEFENQCVRT